MGNKSSRLSSSPLSPAGDTSVSSAEFERFRADVLKRLERLEARVAQLAEPEKL